MTRSPGFQPHQQRRKPPAIPSPFPRTVSPWVGEGSAQRRGEGAPASGLTVSGLDEWTGQTPLRVSKLAWALCLNPHSAWHTWLSLWSLLGPAQP